MASHSRSVRFIQKTPFQYPVMAREASDLGVAFKSSNFLQAFCFMMMVACLQIPGHGAELSADSVETSKENGTWVTKAMVSVDSLDQKAFAVISDLASYRLWALKGMDGKDPVSAGYWENFTDILFQAPDVVTFVCDLNMPWPFGSKGNKLRFRLDTAALASGILALKNIDLPMGLEEIGLRIDIHGEPDTHRMVRLVLSLKYSWLMDLLVDPKGYASHMNEVIGTLGRNLKTYCAGSPES